MNSSHSAKSERAGERLFANSLSIYFFAGDFSDVLRRHSEGAPHLYGTHGEVARMVHDLRELGVRLDIYSFLTPEKKVERPFDGVTIHSLGGRDFREGSLLRKAVEQDSSDAIIAHFPNLDLLRAVARTRRPAMAFLANSFYRRSIRTAVTNRLLVRLLNSPAFQLVTNHCLPATENLARLGVKRDKLLAWDVPHPFAPNDSKPKTAAPREHAEAIYAGSIAELKGVGDIIRALPHLTTKMPLKVSFAGNGDIDEMRSLARQLSVDDRVEFLGSIPNPEVFERFKRADLILVPSRADYPEGFPLTMFESIASHTPIVCSDHPIFTAVMQDRVHAMVFKAGNHLDLARRLDELLADPELFLRLSAAAPETWARLQGPADWRTLIREWAQRGVSSRWITSHLQATR